MSTPGRRISELDVLRGFALCGILVVNIVTQLAWLRGDGDRTLPPALDLIFYERFLAIFALLFGVGFGLFLDRAGHRTDHPRAILARRLAVLLVIGVVHQFFHVGEALSPYALVGLVLLLPMSFLGPRTCLAVAVVLLLVAPQVQNGYGLIVGLLPLGFALARLGVPEALSRHPRRIAACLAVCGVLTAAWVAVVLSGTAPPRVNVIGGLGGGQSLLPPLAGLVTALAYCCVVLLVLRTPIGPAVDAVFAPLGRMALTNYLTATALFLVLGPALGIDSLRQDGAAIAGLTVGILVVQVVWSRWWLARFRYGPVEWAWRCLTWWQRAPFRR